MSKEIKLDKLETRFILNFLLDERNTILSGKGWNSINLNNFDQPIGEAFGIYLKKLDILINKLEKLDKNFYEKKDEKTIK